MRYLPHILAHQYMHFLHTALPVHIHDYSCYLHNKHTHCSHHPHTHTGLLRYNPPAYTVPLPDKTPAHTNHLYMQLLLHTYPEHILPVYMSHHQYKIPVYNLLPDFRNMPALLYYLLLLHPEAASEPYHISSAELPLMAHEAS